MEGAVVVRMELNPCLLNVLREARPSFVVKHELCLKAHDAPAAAPALCFVSAWPRQTRPFPKTLLLLVQLNMLGKQTEEKMKEI